jgi:hypothetical protein
MQTDILHKQLIDLSAGETTPQPPPIPLRSIGGGANSPSSLPPRQRWLTLATNAVDRAGDMLVIAGMDAENFLKNPQFLWQHGASGALLNTIGKVLELRVGRADPGTASPAASSAAPQANMRAGVGAHHASAHHASAHHASAHHATADTLYALVEYAPADISPLAEQVYQMDLAGMLPANSIGFSPIEYEANEFGGYTFTEWELIECSKVELPMNPDAVDGAKSLALEEAADWLLS